jgi:hypothetical protein
MKTIQELQNGNKVVQAKVFGVIFLIAVITVLIINFFHPIDLSAFNK